MPTKISDNGGLAPALCAGVGDRPKGSVTSRDVPQYTQSGGMGEIVTTAGYSGGGHGLRDIMSLRFSSAYIPSVLRNGLISEPEGFKPRLIEIFICQFR
jgi:hypothetical protein